MFPKPALALALGMPAAAGVHVSADPGHDRQTAGYCRKDLGYGRTSGWGCG